MNEDLVMEITEKVGGIHLDATYVDIQIQSLQRDNPGNVSGKDLGLWLKYLNQTRSVINAICARLLNWDGSDGWEDEAVEVVDDD